MFRLLLLLFSCIQISTAQTLVTNINVGHLDSSPAFLTTTDNKVVFQVFNGVTQKGDLYVTDGNEVLLLHEIHSTKMRFLTAIGAHVYYFLEGETRNDLQVWTANVQSLEKTLLLEIEIENFSNSIRPFFTALNDKVYFHIRTDLFAFHLYETDNTAAGTRRVIDLPQLPDDVIELNGQLLIQLRYADRHTEIWTSDGTQTGTQLVKSFTEITDVFQDFAFYKNNNNTAYFSASEKTTGEEVWRTDGTATGTTLVANVATGSGASAPADFQVFNEQLYFAATTNLGRELYQTTVDSFRIVRNIATGSGSSANPKIMGVTEEHLYFAATDSLHGTELWRTDGQQTELVKDIQRGAADGISDPRIATVFKNTLFFVADDGITGTEIWYANTDTVALFKSFNNTINPTLVTEFATTDEHLFFGAKTIVAGRQLWRSDGTVLGTCMLPSRSWEAVGSSIHGISIIDNEDLIQPILFTANDGIHGEELWISNGELKTELLLDIAKGSNGSKPYIFPSDNSKIIYFMATTAETGRELWRTDGTREGTFLLKDIASGTHNSWIFELYYLPNGFTVFAGGESGNQQLWVTDGTEEGTRQLRSHALFGGELLYFTGVVTTKSRLVYVGSTSDDFSDNIIHSTTGRQGGRDQFDVDLRQLGSEIRVKEILEIKEQIYLNVNRSGQDDILVRVNDDQLETVLELPEINELKVVEDWLYFTANRTSRHRLPTTLGRLHLANSTIEFIEVTHNKIAVTSFLNLTPNATGIYFTLFGTDSEFDLWYIANNQVEAAEVFPNSVTNRFENKFVVKDDLLYFAAYTEAHGTELWRHQPNTEPQMLFDLNVGSNGSGPSQFTFFNEQLYFTANDGIHGSELWRWSPTGNDLVHIDRAKTLHLAPNPARTEVHYFNPPAVMTQSHTVRVFDALGRLVLEKQNRCNQLIVNQLSTGWYVVEIEVTENEIYRGRIIIQ